MPRISKYAPLTLFLQNSESESVRMTFSEIGDVITIPPSALADRTAWANCTTRHASPLQKAWLNAGYRVATIDMSERYVIFSRGLLEADRSVFLPVQQTRHPAPESYEEELLLTRPDNLVQLENDEYLLIKLTRDNSAIVEECIMNDPAYQSRGKAIMESKFNAGDYSSEAYFEIIRCIAAENSTRTANDAMRCLAQYCANPDNDFLQRIQQGDQRLVDDILQYLVDQGFRKDKSLASKVCRYLNEWKYNGCAFTINDSVVRAILPYYLAYYHIDEAMWRNINFEELSYMDFYQLFSMVREHADGLNNHELDHLIWYAYKNDGIRTEVAKALTKVL